MSAVRSLDSLSSEPDLSCLKGAVITQVFLEERAAGLVLETDHGVYEWYAEEPVVLRSAGSNSHLNPKVPTSMAPILSLLQRTVSATSLDDDGTLRMAVHSGLELVCAPHPTSHVWQITGPRGFLLVGMPRGNPVLWTER